MGDEDAYTRAGVNIGAGQQSTALMAEAVRSTYGPEVLAGIGAFGGLYDASALPEMAHPVLVASTDGVGTKTKVAARLGRWDTIGRDLVNHCINDILVQGARPLFFLDYVAMAHLDPQKVAAIVGGVAVACREAGCALLGGETAEMPGVYEAGEVDLVGTIVGVVERGRLIDGSRIQPGDFLIALPSSGLHTNGYSLARKLLDPLDWTEPLPELGCSPGDALLAVHRCYLDAVRKWWSSGVDIRGLAHITGGGVLDNLPRILPPGLGAIIQRGSWTSPPIFDLLRRLGNLSDQELFHTFNMGLGMIGVVSPDHVTQALAAVDGEACVVGEIVEGSEGVEVR
jgi:phosphoribosylformylglycinamidine cyclo-ligase